MTSTQKRYLEWPLFIFIVWIWTSLEISLLQLPYNIGSIQLIPILCTFATMYFPMKKSFIFAFIYSILGSINIVIPQTYYMASILWSVLIVQSMVSSFTLESRRDFAVMSGAFLFSMNSLQWLLLKIFSTSIPLWKLFLNNIASSFVTIFVAYLIYPALSVWYDSFEHKLEERRDHELKRQF